MREPAMGDETTVEPLHLGAPLASLDREYARQADIVLADMPGGARGQQILHAVAATAASNQAVLAEQLGVTRTTMTYLLDDLETAGLVQRRPDPLDRRNRLVTHTEAGRALLRNLNDRIREVENDVFAGLTDKERRILGTLLHKAASRFVETRPRARRQP